jgi:hypothetical protein
MRISEHLSVINRLQNVVAAPANVLHYVYKAERQKEEDTCDTQNEILKHHRRHKLDFQANLKNDFLHR